MNMPVDTLSDPIAAHAQAMLANLGEDVHRPGLRDTPKRFAKAMRFLTGGYEVDIGLSKIPRIVDLYARRLQVQERHLL